MTYNLKQARLNSHFLMAERRLDVITSLMCLADHNAVLSQIYMHTFVALDCSLVVDQG